MDRLIYLSYLAGFGMIHSSQGKESRRIAAGGRRKGSFMRVGDLGDEGRGSAEPTL